MSQELRGMHIGVVTTNEDPKGLGRVRVRIPGLIEPQSAWAWPLSVGGGAKDRGLFFPPETGAEVAVWFKADDADCPYYIPAQWGAPGGQAEVPEPARLAGANAQQVKVLETETWRITLDDRSGVNSKLLIENKDTGDRIEFDGATAGISIEGKTAVVIKAIGVIQLEALQITLNGRTVRPSSDPI